MKYFIVFGALGVLVLGLGACKKDFVTKYPQGQVNEGNFFKERQRFSGGVDGGLRATAGCGQCRVLYGGMRSDNTHYDTIRRTVVVRRASSCRILSDNSANPTILALWTADYMGVQRTDIVLDKLATPPPDMVDSVKNQIIGEAKALRAHYYFELVRCYGAVPLYLHEVTNGQNAFLGRSPVDSVYEQIISDLTDAIAKLAPPSAFPQSGRVTKGMASTELALVYMTLHQYDKALPLLIGNADGVCAFA